MRWTILLLITVGFAGCGSAEYSAAVDLPGSQFSIQVVLKQSHPFLAEYGRSFTIRKEGRPVQSDVQLFADSGGYALVNLYRVGSTVLLQTMGNEEYRIDLNTGKVKIQAISIDETGVTHPSEGKFLGAFDFDERGSWNFIPAETRLEKQIGATR